VGRQAVGLYLYFKDSESFKKIIFNHPKTYHMTLDEFVSLSAALTG
jgi:hypothetical protein